MLYIVFRFLLKGSETHVLELICKHWGYNAFPSRYYSNTTVAVCKATSYARRLFRIYHVMRNLSLPTEFTTPCELLLATGLGEYNSKCNTTKYFLNFIDCKPLLLCIKTNQADKNAPQQSFMKGHEILCDYETRLLFQGASRQLFLG